MVRHSDFIKLMGDFELSVILDVYISNSYKPRLIRKRHWYCIKRDTVYRFLKPASVRNVSTSRLLYETREIFYKILYTPG